MNGNAAIDLVLSRVGKWQDTSIRAAALLEMQLAQEEYEQGPNLLWFLFQEKTVTVLAGTDSVALPAGFIRFDDEDTYVKAQDETGTWVNMRVVQLEDLAKATPATGAPRYVSLDTTLRVYPTPLVDTPFRIRTAYADALPTDTAAANLWLENVSYLLVAKTSLRLAMTHLQDFELASSLANVLAEAETRASRFNTARRHAGVDYLKGGEA